MKWLNLALLALCLAGSSSPALGMKNRTPFEIRYYLPVDMAQLDVTVERKTTGSVSWVSGEDGPGWRFERQVTVSRSGNLALRTVADARAEGVLSVQRPSLSDFKASVALTTGGTLAAINSAAQGRGADLVSGLAKFLGRVGGFAAGIPAIPLMVSPAVAVGGRAPASVALPSAPGDACASRPVSGDPDVADPHALEWRDRIAREGFADEALAFADLDVPGCVSLKRLLDARRMLDERRAQLGSDEAGLAGVELKDVTKLKSKLAEDRGVVAEWTAQAQVESDRFTQALNRFRAAKCLGESTEETTDHELLDLGDLPSPDWIQVLAGGAANGPVEVDKQLAASQLETARRVFGRTGVLPVVAAPAATLTSDGSGKLLGTKFSGVLWRRSVPLRVQLWVLADQKEASAPLAEKSACVAVEGGAAAPAPAAGPVEIGLQFDAIVDVLHPQAPLGFLPIEAKAFGDRSLAIVFDPRGQPARIDTSGTSAAAGLASALGSGVETLRDELAATLKKRVEIEDARRALALEPIETRIAALKAQKEELAARAAVLGADATLGATVEKQQLDAQLALLQSQLGLQVAEKTAEQQVAIAELEKRVLETQQRLDLLELQAKLAAASKQP